MALNNSVIIFLKHDKISLQDENFVRNVLQKNLEIIVKLKKFQKFQHLALEVKVDYNLMTNLREDFNISLSDTQALIVNVLICFILAFKELI
jgi:hypothetical protein